jgi:lipid-A-disaccharide synthase
VFGTALELLAQRFPNIRVVMPTVETVASEVAAQAVRWPVEAHVLIGRQQRHDAFAAATVALAASGTVVLELAIAGVPTVVAYKANPLTAWAARRMMRVPFVSLVNLILDRPVMPELLQEQCRPDHLAEAVGALLEDPGARKAQGDQARRAAEMIGLGGPPPSGRAADVVLDVIASKQGA